MSTPVPGRVEVDAPPIEPYTYGLLSVAQVVTEDGRWQMGGVEYETDACAQGGRVEGSCPVPLPPDEQTATLTATPGTGVGVRVTRPSDTATTGVVLVADPNLPAPVTIEVAPPEGALIQVLLDPGDSAPVTTGADGDWTFSYPADSGCPATVVTVPYTAGTDDLGSCLALGYPGTWSSDAASQTTVTYQVRPQGETTVVDSGSLAPGATVPAASPYYAAGTYDVTFTAAGATEPQTGTLTVPGTGDQPYELAFAVDAGTTHNKPLAEGLNWVEGGGPFTVYHRAECNPVGFDQAQQRALARLRLVEPREVEKAFSLQLATAEARQPLGTAAVPLAVALGALEQDAALHYAGQPTLHAPRWAQPYFTEARLVAQQGPVLRTELESRVAFGGGYYDDPQAPADPDPAGGQFWLYATGTVTARRSQPFAHEAFEPVTNTLVAIAERTYALDHDCYTAAVLVTVGGGA
ncbi:hypothetical protein [Streptomyces olivaceus]|uniref:hypothetical protein n=1 Tax=Streptomyces olivaceus TaxID=47716 RepID=UPI001CCC3F00|nr:hypothetical protein [Streptomyces olivaceus]